MPRGEREREIERYHLKKGERAGKRGCLEEGNREEVRKVDWICGWQYVVKIRGTRMAMQS